MTNDSDDVNEFLLKIKELGEKTDREDELRARQLEETILKGRRRRQELRDERTRSISPDKRLRQVKDVSPSISNFSKSNLDRSEESAVILKNISKEDQVVKTMEFLVGPKAVPKLSAESVSALDSKSSNPNGYSINRPDQVEIDPNPSKISRSTPPPVISRKLSELTSESKSTTEHNAKSCISHTEEKKKVESMKKGLPKSIGAVESVKLKNKPKLPVPPPSSSSLINQPSSKAPDNSECLHSVSSQKDISKLDSHINSIEISRRSKPIVGDSSKSNKITSANRFGPVDQNSVKDIRRQSPKSSEALENLSDSMKSSLSPPPLPRRSKEITEKNHTSLLREPSISHSRLLSSVPDLSPARKTPDILTRARSPSPARSGGSFVQSALKRSGTMILNKIPLRSSKPVPDFLDGNSLANDLKKSLGEASLIGNISQTPDSDSKKVEQNDQRPKLPKRPVNISQNQSDHVDRAVINRGDSSEGTGSEEHDNLSNLPQPKDLPQGQPVKPVPPPSRFKNAVMEMKEDELSVTKDINFTSPNRSLSLKQKPSVDKIRELLNARKSQVQKNLMEKSTITPQESLINAVVAHVETSSLNLASSPIPNLSPTKSPQMNSSTAFEETPKNEEPVMEDSAMLAHPKILLSGLSCKDESTISSNIPTSPKQLGSRRWKSPVKQTWLESALKKNALGHQQSPGSPDFSTDNGANTGRNKSESMAFANQGTSRSSSPTKLNYSSGMSLYGGLASGSTNIPERTEGSFLTSRGRLPNNIVLPTKGDKEGMARVLPKIPNKPSHLPGVPRQSASSDYRKPHILDIPVKPSNISSQNTLPPVSLSISSRKKSIEDIPSSVTSPSVIAMKPAILLPGKPVLASKKSSDNSLSMLNKPAVLTPPVKPLSLSSPKPQGLSLGSNYSNSLPLKPTPPAAKIEKASKADDIEALKTLRTLKPSASQLRFNAQENRNEANDALSKLKSGLKRSNTNQLKNTDGVNEEILSRKGLLRPSNVSVHIKQDEEVQSTEFEKPLPPASRGSSSGTNTGATEPALKDFASQLSSVIKRGPLIDIPSSKILISQSNPSSPTESSFNFGGVKKASTFDSSELGESKKPLKHLTKGRARGPQRRLPKNIVAESSSEEHLKSVGNGGIIEGVASLQISKTRGIRSQDRAKIPPAIRSSSRVVSGKLDM